MKVLYTTNQRYTLFMMTSWMLFLFSSFSSNAQTTTSTPSKDSWVVQATSYFSQSGSIDAIAVSGGNTFIGGIFDYVGPNTSGGALLSVSSVTPNLNFAKPNGSVYAVAPDGAGGWYIGGNFTKIGETTRYRAARINSDGSLHAWDPSIGDLSYSGTVYAIAVGSDGVFIGGNFSRVNSEYKDYIVKVDKENGDNLPWGTASTNGAVKCITFSSNGNHIFIGGEFWQVNGADQQYFGKLSVSDGSSVPTANFDSYVYDIIVNGSDVYVGGMFDNIKGFGVGAFSSRIGLAKITDQGLDLYPAFPQLTNTNHGIEALAISGDYLFAGGSFTAIGGVSITNVAKIDLLANSGVGGVVASGTWNANMNSSPVYELAVLGTNLYLGGDFTSVNNVQRYFIARVAVSNGALDDTWKSHAGYRVYAISGSGTNLYVGGEFNSIGGFPVSNIAKIDNASGAADPTWLPAPNGRVNAFAVHSDGTVFIGGEFLTVNGTARPYLARLNINSSLSDWNPASPLNSFVQCLLISGTNLYAGGQFSQVGVNPDYGYLAAFALTDGALQNWQPRLNGSVYTIAASGDNLNLYTGGSFTSAGSTPVTRNRLAKILLSNAGIAGWDPNASSTVYALSVNNGFVYAGGAFTQVSGTPRRFAAKLREDTGALDGWNAALSTSSGSGVYDVQATANDIFIGGSFEISSPSRYNIARLNASDAAVQNWYPVVSNSVDFNLVNTIQLSGNDIYMGGSFRYVNSSSQYALGLFTDRLLPVEMSAFSASVIGNEVSLKWRTVTEVNNYGFDVERSVSGVDGFAKIGFVSGSGNSNSPHLYQFPDAPGNGTFYYRLKQVDTDGDYSYSGTIMVTVGSFPLEYQLHQNYPNPFNPSTEITFSVPKSGLVSLAVYNLLGEKIAQPVSSMLDAGSYTINFDASALSSGIYFYTLKAGEYTAVKKMMLAK